MGETQNHVVRDRGTITPSYPTNHIFQVSCCSFFHIVFQTSSRITHNERNTITTSIMSIAVPLRQLPRLTPRISNRRIALTCPHRISTSYPIPHSSRRSISITAKQLNKMSFSNAETGSKPADPYTQKNLEDTSLKEKVEDLVSFIDKQKFCMMTTVVPNSGLLASRCMALAAKVSNLLIHLHR